MPRPQFNLRSVFILTAIVAVGCWVGKAIWPALAGVLSESGAAAIIIGGLAYGAVLFFLAILSLTFFGSRMP